MGREGQKSQKMDDIFYGCPFWNFNLMYLNVFVFYSQNWKEVQQQQSYFKIYDANSFL